MDASAVMQGLGGGLWALGERAASAPRAAGFSGALQAAKNSLTADPNATRTAQNRLSEFRRTLVQLLRDAGVDTSEEIRLESDGDGGMRLVGDHSDWPAIADVLAANPDLDQKFQELATLYERLENQSAVADDAAFRKRFTLRLNGDEARVRFD